MFPPRVIAHLPEADGHGRRYPGREQRGGSTERTWPASLQSGPEPGPCGGLLFRHPCRAMDCLGSAHVPGGVDRAVLRALNLEATAFQLPSSILAFRYRAHDCAVAGLSAT